MENVIEDLIENNKMIAEFCGFKKHHEQDWYLIPKGFSEHIPHNWQCLLFHTSFDWLMPVVEKIESLGFYFTIEKNGTMISAPYGTHGNETDDMTGLWVVITHIEYNKKIQSVYNAVIEFIKWYNLQNK